MAKRLAHSKPSSVVLAIQAEARRRNYTSYRLAQETGLRIHTMQRLLAGEGSPTISTLEAVAGALDLVIEVKSR
jgi:DNA-binding phage protein